MNILKQKKGMGIFEILVTIIILSIALTSITSILITATRTTIITKTKMQADYAIESFQMIMKEDLLKKESVKTYLTNLTSLWDDGDNFSTRLQAGQLYISNLGSPEASALCQNVFGDDSSTYLALYNTTSVIQIGSKSYDSENVIIEIVNVHRINATTWNITIEIVVTYFEGRTVGGEAIVIYISD